MRIVLLNPPAPQITFRDGYCSSSSKSGYVWHPLDLMIQSGILTAQGHDITFIDAIASRTSAEHVTNKDAIVAWLRTGGKIPSGGS